MLINKLTSIIVVILMVSSAFAVIYAGQFNTESGAVRMNYAPAAASVNTQIGTQTIGNGSFQGVYDPINQLSYIVNSASNNVSIVNSFSGKTIGSINVGKQPEGISYVPFDNEIYVLNHGSYNISIIDPSTESVVATISLPYEPVYSLYDPAANVLFVTTNSVPSNILIISVSNNSFSTYKFTTNSFFGMAYDPYNCGVYIAACSQSGSFILGYVYLIAPSNLKNLSGYSAIIQVGPGPMCMAFDPVNKMLYVSDYDFSSSVSGCPKEYNVTIINTVTNSVVKNLFTGTFPRGIAYDPANGYIYVANTGNSNVSIINPVSNTIISCIPVSHKNPICCPYSLYYDPVGESMKIVQYSSSSDYLLSFDSFSGSLSNIYPVVTGPNAVAYDPVNKFLYVLSGCAALVSVYNSINGSLVKNISIAPTSRALFACYNSHYNEVLVTSGCASPPTYDLISINTTTNTVSCKVPLSTYPNGMAYDSVNNTMFIAVGNTIDVVNLSNNTVFKTINVGAGPCGLTFSPYTDQVYAGETQGSCAIIIDANNYSYYVPFDVSGSHPADVVYDPYSNDLYITDYGGGNVSIIDLSNFDYVCPSQYTNIKVGTNPYSEMIDPSNGLLYVDNAGSYNISVIDPLTNTVIGTFNISGYQSGSFMSYDPFSQSLFLTSSAQNSLLNIAPSHLYKVTLHVNIPGNATMWSSNIVPCKTSDMALAENLTLNVDQNATYFLPNGTYYIEINTTNPEFHERVAAFDVNGSSLNLTYYRYFYLNLNESGLPNGTSWSVLINGTTYTSNKSNFQVPLRNGQYTVNVPFAESFEAYPSSFNISIDRYNVSYRLYFQSPSLQNYGHVISTTDACKALLVPGDSLLINNVGQSFSSSIDPYDNILYLSEYAFNGTASIRMISTTSNLYVGSIKLPVNSRPDGTYFDTSNKMLYVVECGNSTIAVINTANNEIVYNITSVKNIYPGITGNGSYIFVDNSSGCLFEISAYSNAIYKKVSISLPCDLCFAAPVYSNGNIYVENCCDNFITQVNTSTGNVSNYSVPAGFCPYLFIQGPGNMAFVPLYNLTYGYDNSVEIFNETNGKSMGILSISDVHSGVYDPLNGNMYFSASNSSYYGGLGEFAVINTKTLQEISTFPATPHHYYSMVYDSMNQAIYAVSENLEVSVLASQRYYNITFDETGLASGIPWYVNISGVPSSGPIKTSSFSVYLLNGTYDYTIAIADKNYEPSTISSTLNVNGSNQKVNIVFTEIKYNLTFKETGLPAGTKWSVSSNATGTAKTTASYYSFMLPNGTYQFSVSSSLATYSAQQKVYDVNISGSNVTESILFIPVTFNVTITESGLGQGISWSINVSGKLYTAVSGQNIYLLLQNGTYFFTVSNVMNYTLNLTETSFTVNGHSLTITLDFVKNATVSPHVPTKSSSDLYIEIGAIVVVIVVAIAAVLLVNRKKG